MVFIEKEIDTLEELEKIAKKYGNIRVLQNGDRFVGECWSMNDTERAYHMGTIRYRLDNLDTYNNIRVSVLDLRKGFRFVFERGVR